MSGVSYNQHVRKVDLTKGSARRGTGSKGMMHKSLGNEDKSLTSDHVESVVVVSFAISDPA